MKKKRGVIVLALTMIITAFLCYTAAVGLGPTGTGSAKNIHTGLDPVSYTHLEEDFLTFHIYYYDKDSGIFSLCLKGEEERD